MKIIKIPGVEQSSPPNPDIHSHLPEYLLQYPKFKQWYPGKRQLKQGGQVGLNSIFMGLIKEVYLDWRYSFKVKFDIWLLEAIILFNNG